MSGTPIGTAFDRLAEEHPDWPALTTDGTTLSRLELSRRSSRLARALSTLGVCQGDLVTIALPNGVAFIETVLAVWKLGATPQPVSHRLPIVELTAIIELGQPRLVVSDLELESGPLRLDSGFTPAADLDDGPLPNMVAPSWKAPTSGGSTGRPKLIVSTKPGVAESITGIADTVGMRNTPVLMTGPLYHNGPLHYSAAALLLGNHLVLMTRFDAEEALRLIDHHRIGWMYAVPTMMRRLWALPPEQRDGYSLDSLHTLFHIAAPCPPWLKRAWIERLGPDAVVELYGGTEGQAATVVNGREWLERPGTVGRPFVGQVCVLDEDLRPVPPGVPGEVFLRPDGPPTYRYIGSQARLAGEGWESLGDMGWMDEDGYLYLGDRSSDMILVGGANVYPAEVEGALEEHPDVLSACVVGLPDEDFGSVVHAVVQLRQPLGDSELQAHIATKLASYKWPRSYTRVDSPLRDDSGKVRRSAVRADLLSGNSHLNDIEPGS